MIVLFGVSRTTKHVLFPVIIVTYSLIRMAPRLENVVVPFLQHDGSLDHEVDLGAMGTAARFVFDPGRGTSMLTG